MRDRLRSFTGDDNGGIALEFAIIAPVLVLLLIALTDFGLGFYRRMQAQSAAQRGAIFATVRGFDANAISNTITSTRGSIRATPAPAQFCGCPTSSGVVTATCASSCTFGGTTAPAGTYVSASAQTTYATLFKYPGLASPMTFSATQVVRIR